MTASARLTLMLLPLFLAAAGLFIAIHSAQFNRSVAALEEARFAFALSQLRQEIEQQLDLNPSLHSLRPLQQLLVDVRDRDRDILSIDLFDEAGQLVFSTDRGGIGDTIPGEWRRASEAVVGPLWVIDEAQTGVIGAPLVNSFNVVVGGLALRFDREATTPQTARDSGNVALELVLFAAGAAGVVWLLAGWARRRLENAWQQSATQLREARDATPLHPAALNALSERLSMASDTLAEVAGETDRIDNED